MKGKLRKNGHYELFETTKGHQILNLDDKEFYALVEGQRGDIIVHSNGDHEKKQSQEEGQFYLAEFENDAEFRDIPHLFLESEDRYRELLLPNGLPTKNDLQKKVIRTEEKITKKKVNEQVKGDSNRGSERQNTDKAEDRRDKIQKSTV